MVDGSESTGRAFASMLLVKTQGDLTWRQAAAALELPERLGYSLARTGAARLNTDTGTFVEAVLDHTRCHSAAPVDYRAKEHIAMTDFRPQPALAQLRAHLRVPHLRDLLLRERIWTLWALGHPALVATTRDTKVKKARAATQRRRWTADATARLVEWCDDFELKAPAHRHDDRGRSGARRRRGLRRHGRRARRP